MDARGHASEIWRMTHLYATYILFDQGLFDVFKHEQKIMRDFVFKNAHGTQGMARLITGCG